MLCDDMLQALADYGPMTRLELCQVVGTNRTSASIISRLMRPSPKFPKRVHICGYTYDTESSRRYLRALYDLGDKPDKLKPKVVPAETVRRYRQAKVMRVNSVWQLGLTVKQRIAA